MDEIAIETSDQMTERDTKWKMRVALDLFGANDSVCWCTFINCNPFSWIVHEIHITNQPTHSHAHKLTHRAAAHLIAAESYFFFSHFHLLLLCCVYFHERFLLFIFHAFHIYLFCAARCCCWFFFHFAYASHRCLYNNILLGFLSQFKVYRERTSDFVCDSVLLLFLHSFHFICVYLICMHVYARMWILNTNTEHEHTTYWNTFI